MFELVAATRLRLRLDAHRGAAAGRPAVARLRRRGRTHGALVRGEGGSGCGSWAWREEQIAIDPGLDFDLSPEQDLEIMRRLGELRALGLPLYVSLSRKDFIGAVLAGSWEERLPAGEREWGTVAAVTLAVREGADILRIHDRSLPAGDAPGWRGPGRRGVAQAAEGSALQCVTRRQPTRRPGRSAQLDHRHAVGRRDRARRGATGGSSPRPRSRTAPRSRCRCPPTSHPNLVERLRAGRDRGALLAPAARLGDGAALGPDRHLRHRLGQEPRLQPAGARRDRPADRRRGRSTSTRPRRWPRTRRASSPSCGRRACARRSTTATRRARSARRSAANRT